MNLSFYFDMNLEWNSEHHNLLLKTEHKAVLPQGLSPLHPHSWRREHRLCNRAELLAQPDTTKPTESPRSVLQVLA